jgi:hypothetical protein
MQPMLGKPRPWKQGGGRHNEAHHAEPDHACARGPLEHSLAIHQATGVMPLQAAVVAACPHTPTLLAGRWDC